MRNYKLQNIAKSLFFHILTTDVFCFSYLETSELQTLTQLQKQEQAKQQETKLFQNPQQLVKTFAKKSENFRFCAEKH